MKEKLFNEISLRRILDAILFIEKFKAQKKKEDLYADAMFRFATERQMEIIGEAADRLSINFFARYNEVRWVQIIFFRRFIVDDFLGADTELLWNVITEHIPPFKIQIEKILADFSGA